MGGRDTLRVPTVHCHSSGNSYPKLEWSIHSVPAALKVRPGAKEIDAQQFIAGFVGRYGPTERTPSVFLALLANFISSKWIMRDQGGI